jgi:GT2 family glycosyltransferase/glycosyltransferase involved in cell wall biosynthesis
MQDPLRHLTNQLPVAAADEAAPVQLQNVAFLDPTSNRQELDSLDGSFDGFDGICAVGWARDGAKGDTPVSLDVLANNRWVASGRAELLRGDLLDARIGDGTHGFRIPLPVELCDGGRYEICVRAGEHAMPLSPGVRIFQRDSTLLGHVDGLDGPYVVGWVRNLLRSNETIPVHLLIDGKLVSTGIAVQPRPDGLGFSLRIPPLLMDGRPHVISVQVIGTIFLVGEIAVVLPAVSTPVDALRRYSGSFANAALVEGAPARYEALRRQIQFLTIDSSDLSAEEKISRLRQVAVAHEQVLLGFDMPDRPFQALSQLEFPQTQDALVSVVIPVHNKALVTYNCLASLLLAHNAASFEVIVVDDGSSDETLTLLPDLVHGVRFLRHEKAQGFIRSCNDGARMARGAYVLMLNNDTEVSSGWIDELLYVFDHFSDVGMAGAKLLYPNGQLQEAGGIVWNNGDPWNYGREGNPREPRYNYTRQVDYLSGACVMLRKTLWDELGGFDERYMPAYFEDADLAFRVRDCGLKTIYTPFSQVIHFEGISSGTSVTSGTKRFQEINRPKFKTRWSRAFKNNGAIGRDPDLNKDRNIRFRALVIDFSTPQPDRDAGSYAAVQEIRLLQSLGCKVTFVPDNLAYLATPTEDLQRMGVECVYAPFILSIRDLLETRGSEFDLVYVSRYSIAERHIDAIRRFAPQAKVLFNNADLHFLRELRSAIASKHQEGVSRALKTRDDELGLMRKVDLVLSYNEAEHAVIVSHNLDSTRIARCPWVVKVPESSPGFEERVDIAFLGGFSHSPNPEAMEYFVREVMPLLRERLPNVSLRIYGSDISDRIHDLAADDVIIEGWVPDVAQVYSSCRVFIAPLRSGAGIKGKVVGALAFGVPCVLSPLAAEGTGIRDGQEALIAETAAQWVETIVHLYEDKPAWLKMHNAARDYAASEFSFPKGQKLMRAALQSVDIFAESDDSVLNHDGRISG